MKLNDKIKLAIARYYFNRDQQYENKRVEGTTMTLWVARSNSAWDKQADLRAVDAAARKAGYSYAAAGGTFWFGKGNRIIEANESNYLDGGEVKKRPLKDKQ